MMVKYALSHPAKPEPSHSAAQQNGERKSKSYVSECNPGRSLGKCYIIRWPKLYILRLSRIHSHHQTIASQQQKNESCLFRTRINRCLRDLACFSLRSSCFWLRCRTRPEFRSSWSGGVCRFHRLRHHPESFVVCKSVVHYKTSEMFCSLIDAWKITNIIRMRLSMFAQ